MNVLKTSRRVWRAGRKEGCHWWPRRRSEACHTATAWHVPRASGSVCSLLYITPLLIRGIHPLCLSLLSVRPSSARHAECSSVLMCCTRSLFSVLSFSNVHLKKKWSLEARTNCYVKAMLQVFFLLERLGVRGENDEMVGFGGDSLTMSVPQNTMIFFHLRARSSLACLFCISSAIFLVSISFLARCILHPSGFTRLCRSPQGRRYQRKEATLVNKK